MLESTHTEVEASSSISKAPPIPKASPTPTRSRSNSSQIPVRQSSSLEDWSPPLSVLTLGFPSINIKNHRAGPSASQLDNRDSFLLGDGSALVCRSWILPPTRNLSVDSLTLHPCSA